MAGRSVGVETRGAGRWVYLRATLPPKPGSARLRPYQQRIALGLAEIPHNKQKIRAAKKRLEYQLATATFDWAEWDPQLSGAAPSVKGQGLVGLIDGLEKHMLATRDIKQTTFHWNYRVLLLSSSLPRDRAPTGEELRSALMAHSKQSPTRRLLHFACKALADYMELSVELSDLKGSYTPASVQPIDLPSDAQIVDFGNSLDRAELRYLYGLMAVWGLRPHECWFATVDPETFRCRVDKGKTGARLISPLPKAWAIEWDLANKLLPGWTETNNKYITKQIFKELVTKRGMPCRPYALRHCYARRMFEQGIPVALAAKLMGHSERVHTNTYQRWIDEQDVLDVFERLTSQQKDSSSPTIQKPIQLPDR